MTEQQKAEAYVCKKRPALIEIIVKQGYSTTIKNPINLQDWLAVLGGIKSKRTFSIDEDGECFADIGYDRNYVCKFNLTTGQPATESDYQAFNEIVSL